MKIRNAIIITDSDSELSMTLDEQSEFIGNVIFARNKLPDLIANELDIAIGHLAKLEASVSDRCRMSMKPELVRQGKYKSAYRLMR